MFEFKAVKNAWEAAHRACARLISRVLLVAIDAVEHDWDSSGRLWKLIGIWLRTDRMYLEEFLRLLGLHYAAKHGEPSEVGTRRITSGSRAP